MKNETGNGGGFAATTGSPVWKVGDAARIATYGDCRWCEIIDINQGGCVTVMMENGNIAYWEIGSLETRESYLRSCHRMQDEWTGAEYKRMVALADRPFVKHPKWDEWVARATGKENK